MPASWRLVHKYSRSQSATADPANAMSKTKKVFILAELDDCKLHETINVMLV